MKTKSTIIVLLVTMFVFALSGCSSTPNDPSKATNTATYSNGQTSTGASGGTLKIAYPSIPTTLDPHMSTSGYTAQLAIQIFETLVTLNSKYEVVPNLAQSYDISKDGKTITFALRQGVKFHNGKEMKAEDVVASMQKWQKTSSTAKADLGNSTWEAKDDYSVVLHVESPSYILMYDIANPTQFPAIMPKEIIAGADATGVKEYIGTGPFQFKEFKPNEYMLFTKFKEYQPLSTPADGLSGKKEALVDELYFYSVKDSSTAINGLVSGEYDVVPYVNFDALPQIDNAKNVVQIKYSTGITTLVFNKKQGLFANVKARQAVNMALDKKAIMTAVYTGPDFFRLDPGLMQREQSAWYSDAGKEIYEKHDLGQAKQLLKEAGYNGEEVRILASKDWLPGYNAAIAVQQQLQEIGMKVKLAVMDWSTLLDRRSKPDQWEMFFTTFPSQSTPLQYPFLDSKTNWPGWTNSPEIDKLLTKIKASTSQAEVKATFAELQKVFWDEVPVVSTGYSMQVDATSNKVKGYKNFICSIFWNTSITK
ncbi:ABC transporter substrate-binding protein [Paenibacillus sp. N3.4]|uniref:ABC transporter substrate-binding protein n=1 Tax=Paenibacillus sp. N3.4 TaxID=2603222 RepID=UPI0011C9AD23|nr:ABC transporter substrate-binding protein [Paenibacillus sp. N3.4]TXK85947.1 ABC transporter substrate-binding protein [Paenibacillus sp. N3.4]